MTQQEAEKAPKVVTGTLTVCSRNAYVLIDYGATHSFVSREFVLHVNRRLELLPDALLVHTPIGESVIIEYAYLDCELEIDNVVLLVDLLPLVLIEFDVILGMNLLSKYPAEAEVLLN